MKLQKTLRLRAVMEITGLGRSAIYKAVAEKRFPKPVPLAPGCRAKGWLEGDIIKHQKKCIAERDKPKKRTAGK